MAFQELKSAKPIDGDDAWWLNSANIARLLRYIEAVDCIDVQTCIDVCEKPWHWSVEFDEMQEWERERDARQGRFEYRRGE